MGRSMRVRHHYYVVTTRTVPQSIPPTCPFVFFTPSIAITSRLHLGPCDSLVHHAASFRLLLLYLYLLIFDGSPFLNFLLTLEPFLFLQQSLLLIFNLANFLASLAILFLSHKMSSQTDSQNRSSTSSGTAIEEQSSSPTERVSLRSAARSLSILTSSSTPLSTAASAPPAAILPSAPKNKSKKSTPNPHCIPKGIPFGGIILNVIQHVTPNLTVADYQEPKQALGSHIRTWASNAVPSAISYSSDYYTAIHVDSIRNGFHLLLHPFLASLLGFLRIPPGQLVSNGHLLVNGFLILCHQLGIEPTIRFFCYLFAISPVSHVNSAGYVSLTPRPNRKFLKDLSYTSLGWKRRFLFCGGALRFPRHGANDLQH